MNHEPLTMNQSGQVVLILLLVMLVTLSIGVSIVQNSLTEISTSTKTEQSSRAFSAAEAAIEQAIVTGETQVDFPENKSSANVNISPELPDQPGQGLEYEKLGRADFAHFWFINPTTTLPPASAVYNQSNLFIYFGNCDTTPCLADAPSEKPAIELSVVVKNSSNVYVMTKFYYDSTTRTPPNNFQTAPVNCNSNGFSAFTTSSPSSRFYCYVDVSGFKAAGTDIPVLARLRLLYSASPQKVALVPNLSTTVLPGQARIYTATGDAGQTRRIVRVFREKKVVPYFFDFVLFSDQAITK